MRLFVFLVTFIVFTIEAVMHFVAGKMSGSKLPMKKSLPDSREMAALLGVVAVFSVFNAYIISHPAFSRFLNQLP